MRRLLVAILVLVSLPAVAQYLPIRDAVVEADALPGAGTACDNAVVPSVWQRGTGSYAYCSGGVWVHYTITGGPGGSSAFSAITGGENNAAAMVVGTGASLAATGTGTIAATSVPGSGVSGNIAGNAGTATALAADPADCSAGSVANGVNASGVATGCLDPIVSTEIDTSALLRGILGDESGTGLAVFQGGDVGAATATTPAIGDNDTSIATTAFLYQTTAASSSPALGAGQVAFSTAACGAAGGLVWEGAGANGGEGELCLSGMGVSTDATIQMTGVGGATRNVAMLESSQTFSAAQTFSSTITATGATRVDQLNDAFVNRDTVSIATTLALLPSVDGVLSVNPTQTEATAFGLVNPAGVSATGSATGKKDALVVDERNGRIKFQSSARPPWSGANAGVTHASAEDVPFVFKVQYRDKTNLLPDDVGGADAGLRDGESWSCGRDYLACVGGSSAGRACAVDSDCNAGTCSGASSATGCSENFPSGGSTNPAYLVDYLYGGHFNLDTNVAGAGGMMGPGSAILQVIGPTIDNDGDGVWDEGDSIDKPIVSIGTSGVGIYMPEKYDEKYYSPLTIYRPFAIGGVTTGDALRSTPYFSVNTQGLFVDGGAFFGNTVVWPQPLGLGNNYGSYNAYVHKDIANLDPAFVSEGAGNSSADAEDGPIGWFTSWANGAKTSDHRGVDPYGRGGSGGAGGNLVAFGIYENSGIVLASECNEGTDAGCTANDNTQSQFFDFCGMDNECATDRIRLYATEATGLRTVALPDLSGTIALKDAAQSWTAVQTFSTAPVISTITNTGTLTLPTSTDTLVGKATSDVFTNKTLDAGSTGNVLSIEDGASSAASTSENIALDTSNEGQLSVYNGEAKYINVEKETCRTMESLATTDDGVLFMNWRRPVKILSVACKYTGASLPTITLTNGTNNIQNGTTDPTCATGTPTYLDVSGDADGTIAAGGFVDFDTGNAAAAASWTMICITYKETVQ